jgi:hypothetical protein
MFKKKKMLAAIIVALVAILLLATPVLAGNGNNGKTDTNCPGWGYGDNNHNHYGPPGWFWYRPGWGWGDPYHSHMGPYGWFWMNGYFWGMVSQIGQSGSAWWNTNNWCNTVNFYYGWSPGLMKK